MRELQTYLLFLQKNLKSLFLFSILGAFLGYFYLSQLPSLYTISSTWKLNSSKSMEEQVVETDQLIAESRAFVLANNKGLPVKSVIYKSGPLLINIEIEGDSISFVQDSLRQLESPFQTLNHKKLSSSGPDVKDPPSIFIIFLGTALGFLSGVVFSLVSIYLRRH